MPDISMCQNKNCKVKEQCYRFTAIPDNLWQAYAEFGTAAGEKCEYFWAI